MPFNQKPHFLTTENTEKRISFCFLCALYALCGSSVFVFLVEFGSKTLIVVISPCTRKIRGMLGESVLILKATDAKAARTDVTAHDGGAAAVKVQVAAVAAINRAGPVVAGAACVAERAIIAVAVTRHNKLQW